MSTRLDVDVSELPEEGFGPKSAPWWGTLGFMLAEATTLALCAASYLYLARRYTSWPPAGLPAPDILIPTISAAWLVASLVPARLLAHAARRHDRRAVTIMLVVGVVVEAIAIVLRAFEFDALGVRWDTNSYGSIVWWTLGLHTTLLAADFAETAVFAAIFLSGRVEPKHYSDADDVAFYWYFVALGWIPLYVLLYLSPRLL
jgi:cytochrome c oxidase subunit III